MSHLKTCPVVLKKYAGDLQILLFRHPLAGVQLVKGTIEKGEDPQIAAERELFEEAGIHLRAAKALGQWRYNATSPLWHFWQMDTADHLPETWTHYCLDDGGHDFEFFWHPFYSDYPPSNDGQWGSVFAAAFNYLQGHFRGDIEFTSRHKL